VDGVYSVVHDNETGLVVRPSNSQQLADKILELLADPVRARAIGEAGRRMVRQEFRVEKMVDLTARLYHDVLADKDDKEKVESKKEKV
jgi:glycosyltransferase involved in cell wall biosynthesis